jgi:hypothetical protein
MPADGEEASLCVANAAARDSGEPSKFPLIDVLDAYRRQNIGFNQVTIVPKRLNMAIRDAPKS